MTQVSSKRSGNGPFSGLRVIDFTHVLAGPACAYFLSSLGADVIKVETVGRGDSTRFRGGTDGERSSAGLSTAFLTQGGGKRSIAIDIADPQGYEVMKKLLQSADVFVENHRPSLLKLLRLEYETVAAINPKIIHCAMTGYGRNGPKADAPAYDVNIQAACGLMTMTGEPGSGPTRTGAPIMDYGTALSAGFAIASALFQRTQTQEGTFIDVSMLETAMTLMSSTVTDFLATGNAPVKRGNAANSRSPAAGSFPTGDGMLSLGINEEHQFQALADVLVRSEWKTDPRFADRPARAKNAEVLESLLTAALAERSAKEWESALLAAGVPAAYVRRLPEALEDPQITSRHFLHNPGGDEAVSVTVPSLPFRIGEAEVHAPDLNPPRRGEHSVEILHELAIDENHIQNLLSQNIIEQSSAPLGQ
ncbi:CaiB/BaiF CoA-transferase family protein [Magnetospira sp. QH-2]|uniref:CaiB/BaiF CoA transferase family protein n=1 Tax=Magnetospira sp. (strain QH-2) TaxID=1288970 RepID=UPI0003E8198E|nr:CoA transferase [Magnetospira sp. QH-2]CCQ75239.1 putative L-carnitine dehydratase/acyl-CoA transferase [Magnetospira sp. QH-2]